MRILLNFLISFFFLLLLLLLLLLKWFKILRPITRDLLFLNVKFKNIQYREKGILKKLIINPEAETNFSNFIKFKRSTTLTHGAAIYRLNSTELMISLHTTKPVTEIGNVEIKNINIDEAVNPIKKVNPITILKVEDFKIFFSIIQGKNNYWEASRYGYNNEIDLYYLSLRAFSKAISQTSVVYFLKFQNDKLEINWKDIFLTSEQQINFNPAEVIFLENDKPMQCLQFIEEISVINENDFDFKSELLSQYKEMEKGLIKDIFGDYYG